MTRRDFQLIAGTLKGARTNPTTGGCADARNNEADTLTLALADALAGTNPRFDRGRFLHASGVDQK